MSGPHSDHNYFFEKEEDLYNVTVKPHVFYPHGDDENTDWEKPEENAQIIFRAENVEIEITIPRERLKRLIIAGKNYLKTGKESYFLTCEDSDEFIEGEINKRTVVPAEEALSRGL